MVRSRLFVGVGVLCAAMLAVAGCGRSSPAVEASSTEVELGGVSYRVSGPYTHENLAVFLIHSPAQDEQEFITLDQGLQDGTVKVTEKTQEQVSELLIDNQSELPLFLQEGDRVQGGKQDRTIASSLVIPAKSGPMPLPAFCIEHGRWVKGASGERFVCTSNCALAPKSVRGAAKYANSQGQVWAEVRKEKEVAEAALKAPNSNSSLNETLEAPQVKKLSDEFARALAKVLGDHPDAVGVVIAVNGEVEEVDIYPNHQLLGKLYPRLLQSYALAAVVQKEKAKDAKALAAAEVCKWMVEGKEQSRRTQQVDARNEVQIEVRDGAKAASAASYEGKPVHRQILGNVNLPEPNGARGGQQQERNNPPSPAPPPGSQQPQRQ